MKISEKLPLSTSDLKNLLRSNDGELLGEIIKLNKTAKYNNRLDVIRLCSIIRSRRNR